MALSPMLAELKDEAFNSPKWTWQVKYDGARCIVETKSDGTYRLWSRSGKDMTEKFPELSIKTKLPSLLDGEMVCLDENGRSIFNLIQHRTSRDVGVAWAVKEYPAQFMAFDILQAGDHDMQSYPLGQRLMALDAMVVQSDLVKVAPTYEDGVALFAEMESKHWEGVIGKNLETIYRPGKRGFGWIKVKTGQRGIFRVVGYTAGTGWRANLFGALLLADDKGNYVGGVGTGFTNDVLDSVLAELKAAGPGKCPWPTSPEPASARPTWINPVLTAEIRYLEFTNDGRLRFPVFVGLN